ncbi:unnamed protein product [Callosobruchus maculatus]|uniref:Uncharacterized protein n=1 Tax=Callosobruchus maculatus TaxID=64391 RepID=A0A653CYV8_CALMS|nr:unnamed protein product [Callosobruchus maculatus]
MKPCLCAIFFNKDHSYITSSQSTISSFLNQFNSYLFVSKKNILVMTQSELMGNVIYSIIWLLILFFISFFVAGFCAGFYIIVHPLSVCLPPLTSLAELLLQGVQFPHYCAEKMMSGAPLG